MTLRTTFILLFVGLWAWAAEVTDAHHWGLLNLWDMPFWLKAIFSILLHSFVDFNLQVTANWMFFCLVLGLAWGLEHTPRRRSRRSTE